MAASAPRADFKLILNSVNPAQQAAIIAELMDVLNIDRAAATGATQNVPIVLIGGLTQQQAAILRTHVIRLTKLGAELRLTAEAVGKVKALRWQALPPIVRRPANLFVCPACGERFIVQRVQPAGAQRPPAQARPAAAAPRAPAAAAAPPLPPAEEIPEAEPLEAEALDAEPLEEGLPAAEAEELEPAEALEAEPVEAEELLEALPEEGLEPEPSSAETPAAAPPRPQPVPRPPAPQAAAAPRPPAAQQAPAQQPQAAAGSAPRYDVSVAKVRGPKQDRLAEIIAGRLGVSFEEALKLCERTVIMLCKDAPESEADEWRRAVEKIGLKPRIRKR